MENDKEDGDYDAATREVYVEAPAPGDVLSEGAAEQGADDAGDAKHGAYQALEHWASLEWYRLHDYHNATVRYACTSGTSDGSAHDEGGRRGCCSA